MGHKVRKKITLSSADSGIKVELNRRAQTPDRDGVLDVLADRPQMTFETYGPDQITEEVAKELADYYRYIFDNEWEYIYCHNCDQEDCGNSHPSGMRKTAKEVFGYGKREMVPKEIMYADNVIFPDCECCKKPMKRFIEEGKTFQNMKERVFDTGDGYICFMRNEKGDVVGAAYAYGKIKLMTTHEEETDIIDEKKKEDTGNEEIKRGLFEQEFKEPHRYTTDPDPGHNRSGKQFIQSLRAAFKGQEHLLDEPIHPNMKVTLWNCIAMNPTPDIHASQHDANGNRITSHYLTLMRSVFDMMPDDRRGQLIVAEVIKGSPAHMFFQVSGVRDIPGFLHEPETLIVFTVGECQDSFRLTWQEFYRRRDALRNGEMTREQVRALLHQT